MIAATEYPTKMTLKGTVMSNMSDGRLKSLVNCCLRCSSNFMRWDGKLPRKKLHLLDCWNLRGCLIGWLLSQDLTDPIEVWLHRTLVDKDLLTDHAQGIWKDHVLETSVRFFLCPRINACYPLRSDRLRRRTLGPSSIHHSDLLLTAAAAASDCWLGPPYTSLQIELSRNPLDISLS